MKNGLLRILNDLDSTGRGKKRDKEEGVTRRKKRQGGMRDGEEGGTGRKEGWGGSRVEESEKNEKVVKKDENEKVAKGRIIGLAGPCYETI